MIKSICLSSKIHSFLKVDESKNYLPLKKRILTISLSIFQGLQKVGISFSCFKSITESLRNKIKILNNEKPKCVQSILERLPPEIVIQIFSETGVKELGHLASVSKGIKAISEDEMLWKFHLKKQGYSIPSKNISAKKHYAQIINDKKLLQIFVKKATAIIEKNYHTNRCEEYIGEHKKKAVQAMTAYYILTQLPIKKLSMFINNNYNENNKPSNSYIVKCFNKPTMPKKKGWICVKNKKELKNVCIKYFAQDYNTAHLKDYITSSIIKINGFIDRYEIEVDCPGLSITKRY